MTLNEVLPATAGTAVNPTAAVDARLAGLAPLIRQHAAHAEAERQLAPAVATALIDAGLFQTWVPKAYGGDEMDPLPALRLFEELARIDGSVGWVVPNSCSGAFAAALFPEDGAAEIFADPRTVIAGVLNPPGTAVPVDGGYRVTGRWPFASGCHFATWMLGICLVMDGDSPKLGPDGAPIRLTVFFRADEAEIVDTWHTLGMRGTGSADIRVSDVFVPVRRGLIRGPDSQPGAAFAGPLYRLGMTWLTPNWVAVTGLGIARAALDDFLALAATKTPNFSTTGLADRSSVQERVARAMALILAGRSLIHSAVSDAWEHVQDGARITSAEGIPLALAASFGLEAAVRAVDLVHAMAGTTAVREEHRFPQYFRDIHTLSQHAFASTDRYESAGKLILGRRSDWAAYNV
jgi:alkylation response protein AidB-like acyl-CoA dehydrogenase